MKILRKYKLSTIFVIGFSVILVLLTVILSFVSIRLINSLGDYMIDANVDNIKKDVSVFFKEVTERTAKEYSTYFTATAEYAIMLVEQISTELKQMHDSSYFSQIQDKFNCVKDNDGDELLVCESDEDVTFYWGEEKKIPDDICLQLNAISRMKPIFHSIIENADGGFINIWVKGEDGYLYVYPKTNFTNNYDIPFLQENYANYKYEVTDDVEKWIIKENYKSNSEKILSVEYPFTDSSGKFLAVLGINLNLQVLVKNLESKRKFISTKDIDLSDAAEKIGCNNIMFILDSTGDLLAFPTQYLSLLSLPDEAERQNNPYEKNINISESLNPNVVSLIDFLNAADSGIEKININGESYIFCFVKILPTNLILCYTANENALLSIARDTHKQVDSVIDTFIIKSIIITIIFLLISIILAAIFFKYFLLKPLWQMRKEIKKTMDGNFNFHVEEFKSVELNELSSAFNFLGTSIKEYIKNLEKEISMRQSIETEIDMAAEVQRNILPKLTSVFIRNEFDLYATLKPAKDISGDFYDFFYINDKQIVFLIADVVGKGLPATFFMSMSKVLIKNFSQPSVSDPSKILDKVNATLCNDNSSYEFVTVFLAIYNIDTSILSYANAGHHEAIRISSDNKFKKFGAFSNLPVGFASDTKYKSGKLTLNKNDTVVLYTDGILEARSSSGIEYGEERLTQILLENINLSVKDLCHRVVDSVSDFEEENQFDDVTILAFRKN